MKTKNWYWLCFISLVLIGGAIYLAFQDESTVNKIVVALLGFTGGVTLSIIREER